MADDLGSRRSGSTASSRLIPSSDTRETPPSWRGFSFARHFLRSLACAGFVLASSACSPVDLDSLPAIPDVRTDKLLAGVRAQLDEAFAAVRERPGDAQANGHLAMLLQTYKQFSAADSMYRRARALEPDEFRWAYLHGTVLIAVGDPDAAIATFEQALEMRPDYVLARVRLAELLADRGDVARAGGIFDEVMTTPRPPSEAYFAHGKFLLRQGNVDHAIRSFQETLRLSGDLGVAHYQLGLAYRERGESELAERHLRLAKKHQGYSGDSADRVLNELLPLNLSEQPFVHRAKILAENGRFDEARRFIAMALERNPDSVAAHASMMGMAAREGDFSAVDEHYARAVAIEPDNAKVYFNLGIARIAEQRWIEAQRAFEKSLSLDDTDANTHVQLAILEKRGDNERLVERHLRQAVQLDPDNTLGTWLLGELLSESDRSEEAIPLLVRAADAGHRMTPLILAALAEAQLRASRLDDADATISRARADARVGQDAGVQARIDAIATRLREARQADDADGSG